MRQYPAMANTGKSSEEFVCCWLSDHGYTVIDRNVRQGRWEIDIVARNQRFLVFCEVKSRKISAEVSPEQSLTTAQCERIRQAARRWWLQHPEYRHLQPRFDFAAVSICFDGAQQIEYYESAF